MEGSKAWSRGSGGKPRNQVEQAATDVAAAPAVRRGLLVLDTAYTYETICALGLQDSVTCRDLDGFFDHVWSVHPFASLLTSKGWAPRFGLPVSYRVNDRHSFVEAKVGRFAALRRFRALNFLLAQASLLLRLRRLIRRNRIRLIRVGDPLYLGLFGLLLSKISRVPMAIRVNGNNEQVRQNTKRPLYPRLFRNSEIERGIERFVLRRANLVAAINPDNLKYAIEAGARPERTTLFRLGNLIAKEHLAPPEERELDPRLFAQLNIEPRKFLLCIGRLERLKWPDDAVRAWAAARRKGHDMKLVMAGDGSLREEVIAVAEELGIAPLLVMAGNRAQSELAQLIPASAAVISPMTGRSLTESAFGAAPVVGYDLDWQSELIESDVTGELVPFRDQEALARAVTRLLDDAERARAMGRALRDRAVQMLDPEALNEHERTVYRQLLDEPAGRGAAPAPRA